MVTATYSLTDLVWSMAIATDGKTLICGGRDRYISLLDLDTGAVKSTNSRSTLTICGECRLS